MSSSSSRNTKATILLVEEDASLAMQEANILGKYGFEVLTASDAHKAIERVKENSIDLILMDIDLGHNKMDGTEAAKIILQDHELPLIFLTNRVEKEYVDRIKNITSYGYVVKESGEFVLIESINMALKLFQMQQRIKASELRYREIVDNVDSAIIQYDPEGHIIFFNKGAEKIFGYKAEEIVGTTGIGMINPPVDSNGVDHRQLLRDVFEDDEQYSYNENENMRKDGTRLWMAWRNKPVNDENGNRMYNQCIGYDITERKQTEEALRESEESLRIVLENLPTAVFVHDLDGNFVMLNRNSEVYTGYSREELQQMKVADIDHGSETRNDRENIWRQLGYGECKRIEATHFRKDGSSYPVEIHISAIRYKKEPLIIAIAQDITERKQTEKEKDYLMKEINHRVKNNLIMISSLISLKDSSLGEAVDLSDISHQIDAIRIVHEKLYESEHITHVRMQDYVEELLDTIFSSFTDRQVTIENTIGDISILTKTAVSLGLVINELATNAIKHGFIPEKEARFTVDLQEDTGKECYILTVSNIGKPFPEEISLDNPHTLGLRLISVLVDQLDGTIELQRQPYPTFTITFPAGG
jgi:PAS domain S-box-containing protein